MSVMVGSECGSLNGLMFQQIILEANIPWNFPNADAETQSRLLHHIWLLLELR